MFALSSIGKAKGEHKVRPYKVMPTYEYKCEACGHTFENFQSMSSDPIRKCPKCKKLKVKRLIGTGAGLIFKGSGFYITDYRDQSYTDKAKADSGTAPAGDAKSDGAATPATGDTAKPAATTTETKPVTSTEIKPAVPAKSESKPEAKSSSSKKKSK